MDTIPPDRRRENMRRIRSKGMKPELAVRRLVHGMGYRYRLHGASLPGKPDLVFAGRKKVVFVNGCFWHQHTRCRISRVPKSNRSYWAPKLRCNKERDRRSKLRLRRLGWKYFVVWECQLDGNLDLAGKLRSFLG